MDARRLCAAVLMFSVATTVFANHATDRNTDRRNAVHLDGDNCRFALTQPSVNARNTSTERLRTISLKVRDPANLEKLGWAYLAGPDDRYRDERLYLTSRIADCLREFTPDSHQAMLLSAKVAHENHRFKQAEDTARQLTEIRGSWFDFAVLGDALVEQGNIEGAITAYRKMAALKPGAQTYSRIAHIRWLTGDLNAAMDLMVMAIQAISPRDPAAAVWARSTLAGYLFEDGRHDMAIAVADQALSIQIDHPQSLYIKGRALIENGRLLTGLDTLRSAIEASPLPEYRWALQEVLSDADRWSESDSVRKAIVADGQRSDPRAFALYLANSGQSPDLALDIASRELDKRQDPLTLDVAAWAAWAADKHSLAANLIERSLASGIQHPRIIFHAAVIIGHAGDSKRSAALAARARRAVHFLLPSERRLLNRMSNPAGVVSDAVFIQPTHLD